MKFRRVLLEKLYGIGHENFISFLTFTGAFSQIDNIELSLVTTFHWLIME